MNIRLRNGADDDWICVCGNTVLDSGFFPCNRLGEQVEPTGEDWTTNWYVCAECGRMIDQATHEVVGIREALFHTPMRTPKQMLAILEWTEEQAGRG